LLTKKIFHRNVSRKLRSLAIFTLGLTLTFVTLSLSDRPGWIIYDWLQRSTALPNTSDVAMVLVDQHSIDELASADKITFPFPRQLYGLINKVAARAGAKGLLYDILFTEPSFYGSEDDDLFAKMIKDAGVPTFMPAASEKGFVKEPVPVLKAAVTSLGGVHFKGDADGVIRTADPILPGSQGEVLSLPEAAYEKLANKSELLTLPPQDRLLRFYGAKGIPFVSFYDVILAYRALENGGALSPAIQQFKNRVLVVGFSAPGLHDLKPIPTDGEAPGVLVPATALANRFGDAGMTPVSRWTYLGLAVAFLLAVLLAATLIETPKMSAFVVGFLFPMSTLGLCGLFWKINLWLNPFPMALGLLASAIALLLTKFYAYWAERRKFAKSLEYSMSPAMVRMIRSGQLEVERYGEQREISILFCDIAGFTKMSEGIDPKQLVTLFNSYADAAVDLIFRNGGYVDKFIGDAVMAFWGAPIPQLDHASRALEIAMAYDFTVQQFNEKARRDFPQAPALGVRVGVHTGNAIVGNIGARNRHNYTAIGDGVNLASRLESLAKVYKCSLIISEQTIAAARAKDRAGMLELDHVVVQGRSEATRIYTFVAELWAEDVLQYKKALTLYYEGQWQPALQIFQQIQNIPAATVMSERCQRGLDGKLKEWNQGVWIHDSK
jgi:adenylate cyclase